MLVKLDSAEVLAKARLLQRAARKGQVSPRLRGKHIGLVCKPHSEDAALFRRAAAELGATVVELSPGLSEDAGQQQVQHVARALGFLYSAIECEGLMPTLVRQLGEQAGIPVYDGLATAAHPTAGLARELGDETSPQDNRRFVMQAVLLSTLFV